MTFGSFGAGSVRRQDPLLEEMFLSWLRFGHGQLLSMIILWVGVLIMIGAWVRVGRATLAGTVGLRDLWTVLPAWTAPLLVATPMFSRDAYSYLAQGAMLRAGFDPYTDGPVVNPGVLLDNVSNVWTTTTTPYGPVHLLLGSGITAVTGDNVVSGTWLWRVTMLPGLFLMAWAVPRLARRMGGNPAIALWLAVLNPLVLIHLVGGVHNELLMVGLMTAGIVLVLQGRHVVAHGGRGDAQVVPLGEGLGADGLLGADVVLDDGAQHLEPAFTEHHAHLQKPSGRYFPRRSSSGTLRTRVPVSPPSVRPGGTPWARPVPHRRAGKSVGR